MKIPSEFDEIRPYEPEELPAVYERLLADDGFRKVIASLYPNVPFEKVAQILFQCKDSITFQKTFAYPFLENLLKGMGCGCEMDSENIDVTKRYTFISNHRDIILDSAFLAKLLLDAGFSTTVEIAIGDNLLARQWINDLVRTCKAFIVQRSLSPREFLISSKRMSEYMHFVVNAKHENIWIAQREGRAKDSNDLTQPSILKMMCMGGEGSLKQRLKDLHLCPLTISYEYDPCDYLKAKEFQLKRDTDYKKTKDEDVLNMRIGIFGQKGHVHYHCAPCIDEWIDTLPDDMPKGEFFDIVADHISKEIHRNYMIYPCNRIALDMLEGTTNGGYTDDEKAKFESYLETQLAKIDIENADKPFLRERILTMYANPLRNYDAARKE
ncbi:MAG: 1-acyl-sn-glycerol-3-phosphate acyltransferase [Prevotellaceae bacterium]|nr:1-acyl-sn-glycerol-3-phosphate acyltransferase [Prevotellaceae bacterium]